MSDLCIFCTFICFPCDLSCANMQCGPCEIIVVLFQLKLYCLFCYLRLRDLVTDYVTATYSLNIILWFVSFQHVQHVTFLYGLNISKWSLVFSVINSCCKNSTEQSHSNGKTWSCAHWITRLWTRIMYGGLLKLSRWIPPCWSWMGLSNRTIQHVKEA